MSLERNQQVYLSSRDGFPSKSHQNVAESIDLLVNILTQITWRGCWWRKYGIELDKFSFKMQVLALLFWAYILFLNESHVVLAKHKNRVLVLYAKFCTENKNRYDSNANVFVSIYTLWKIPCLQSVDFIQFLYIFLELRKALENVCVTLSSYAALVGGSWFMVYIQNNNFNWFF